MENPPSLTPTEADAPAATQTSAPTPAQSATPTPAPTPPPSPQSPAGNWVWVADPAQPAGTQPTATAPTSGTAPAQTASPAPAATQPAPDAAPQKRFSKLAFITFLSGLLVIFWPFTIVCGHFARGRIRRSRGRLTGGGIALFGLLLGYLSMGAAIASTVSGGLYVWRITSNIRADIAAGLDPTQAVLRRLTPVFSKLGEPFLKGIMTNEALLPAAMREKINAALDESAEQRLTLVGQWLLQQAASNNGKLPASLDGFGKDIGSSLNAQLPNGTIPAGVTIPADVNIPKLPAKPTAADIAKVAAANAKPANANTAPTTNAQSATTGNAPSLPAGSQPALNDLELSMFASVLTKGLTVVPNLTTAQPPETIALHYAKPLADGTVPVFLLNGTTARLQPNDTRLAALKLEPR